MSDRDDQLERARAFYLATPGLHPEVMVKFHEAEKAREAKLSVPYTPKVGDVVTWGTRFMLYRLAAILGDGRYTLDRLDGTRWDSDYKPHAPLSLATPAERIAAGVEDPVPVDPRRVVGAVVATDKGWTERIVFGDGLIRMARGDSGFEPIELSPGDKFLRWATPEECARHGIPYVERGAVEPKGGADLGALRKEWRDAKEAWRRTNRTDAHADSIASTRLADARRALADALVASRDPQSKGKAVKS